MEFVEADRLVEQVVKDVAASKNVDPFQLPPLYDAIDPEALEKLIHSAVDIQVDFQYADVAVSVDGNHNVEVHPHSYSTVDEGESAATD
ncbi:HalOD1 output domain-containing protein [Halobacteriales archaeon Cl-PHB]